MRRCCLEWRASEQEEKSQWEASPAFLLSGQQEALLHLSENRPESSQLFSLSTRLPVSKLAPTLRLAYETGHGPPAPLGVHFLWAPTTTDPSSGLKQAAPSAGGQTSRAAAARRGRGRSGPLSKTGSLRTSQSLKASLQLRRKMRRPQTASICRSQKLKTTTHVSFNFSLLWFSQRYPE